LSHCTEALYAMHSMLAYSIYEIYIYEVIYAICELAIIDFFLFQVVEYSMIYMYIS